MKTYLKMIRPFDVIIIICLILLSFLPLAIFSYSKANEKPIQGKQKLIAVISIDGKKYRTVELTGHKGKESFTIKQDDGDSNTIEVNDEAIKISAANCTDQVCIRMGAINKPAETITCLPHKLLIEVKAIGDSDNSNDDVIIPS
ncbi:NusG domain II-containing protein [Listeria sp. PSOL-1]|uniref:NusG domain II-containing protein n=1 Tax=Listeria sp. PSOL-1 TaxID=1844999 RepID=UPI0013D2178A|nr:NusG domain II-containing protein [Listeria sp. PSOL-1]